MSVFFTADLHLGHKAIVDHCHRPFKSVEEMDVLLISRINDRLIRGDSLYIVGDFCLGNAEKVKAYRERIECPQVYLVRGNHESLSERQYAAAGFIFKGDIADIRVQGQKITLCHYAMRRWNCSHYGAWHLYGHSHGHLPDDPSLFAFDIGVDCWEYAPLSFEQISAKMRLRGDAVAAPNHEEIAP